MTNYENSAEATVSPEQRLEKLIQIAREELATDLREAMRLAVAARTHHSETDGFGFEGDLNVQIGRMKSKFDLVLARVIELGEAEVSSRNTAQAGLPLT
jgi:hypothetical protein